jgi:hypothetical protein
MHRQSIEVRELGSDLEAEPPHHAAAAARMLGIWDQQREIVRHLIDFRMKSHAALGQIHDQAIARGARSFHLDAPVAIEFVARRVAPFLVEHPLPRLTSSEAGRSLI